MKILQTLRNILYSRRGWTYPDLIVAAGVLAVLVTLTTMSLSRAQFSAYERTALDNLAADMSIQQTRAMMGDAAAAGTVTGYGIYFQSDRYTLFKGNSYSASNPENVVIRLNPSFSFSSIGFPSGQLIYASKSGAFANFASGQNTVVLRNNGSGSTQTLTVNSYGVLEQVN